MLKKPRFTENARNSKKPNAIEHKCPPPSTPDAPPLAKKKTPAGTTSETPAPASKQNQRKFAQKPYKYELLLFAQQR